MLNEYNIPAGYKQVPYVYSGGVGIVDLGSLTYTKTTLTTVCYRNRDLSLIKVGEPLLSNGFIRFQGTGTVSTATRFGLIALDYSIATNDSSYRVLIKWDSITSAADLVRELAGIKLVYTLATTSHTATKIGLLKGTGPSPHTYIPCKRLSDGFYGLYCPEDNTFTDNLGGAYFSGHDDLFPKRRLPAEYDEVEYLESDGKIHVDSQYIAAQRKSDDAYGLYDVANETFTEVADPSPYHYGAIVPYPEEISLGGKEVACIKASILPQEYQQVEYLESHGTEYIDTNLKASSNLNINIDIMPMGSIKRDSFPFGDIDLPFLYYLNIDGNLQTYVRYGNTYPPAISTIILSSVKYNIKVIDGKWFIDNEMIYDGSDTTFTNPDSFKLFAANYNPNMGLKIYRFSATINGENAMNFIPCYRKSDHKPGLYDLANSRKNLFDSSKSLLNNKISRDGETFTSTVMANTDDYIGTWLDNTRVSISPPIVEGNRSYYTLIKTSAFNYISVGWLGVSDSDSYMKYDVSGISDGTIITVSFNLIQERTSSQNGVFNNVQIEEGSAATTYEPYPFYTNQGTGEFGVGDDIPMYDPDTLEVIKDYPDWLRIWEKYRVKEELWGRYIPIQTLDPTTYPMKDSQGRIAVQDIGIYGTQTNTYGYYSESTNTFTSVSEMTGSTLQRISYIGATGEQYILPNITGNVKWSITAQGEKKNTTQVLVSSSQTAADGTWAGEVSTSGKWGIGDSVESTIDVSTKAELEIDFTSSSQSGTINGESLSHPTSAVHNTWALMGTSVGNYGFTGKLFSAKATVDDVIVRDYIPIKAGAVYCLLDKVNWEIIGSASGVGFNGSAAI